MNNLKKILPNLLVMSSILCLIVFLVVWNVHQYEQAENSLKKELSFHLESATNKVNQRQFNKFIGQLDIDIAPANKKGLIPIVEKDSSSIIVAWMDSVTVLERKEFRFTTDRNRSFVDSNVHLAEPIRYKTLVKNISTKCGDVVFPERLNGLDFFALTNADDTSEHTEKALLIFKEKLKKNELPNDFVHVKDSLENTSHYLPITYDSPSMLSELKTLYFQQYASYLFSQIVSSLLFSFCLLTLVVIAFVVILRSLKRQKRMVEIKNDFISNMTHELKTPISTISVAIEAIRKYDVIKDKAKTEEYLDISSNELSRLSLLVQKVLRTTLFESGKGFLNLQMVDLSVLVKETLDTMRMHFDEQKVSLKTDLADTSLWVMADKLHLTNVVYNLIENAVKYSGDSIDISVSTKQVGSKVILTVTDKGVGIPLQHQKQIFTKFYRVPNHDRHNVKGHGLGLSYVKQVIDELGGSIELKSQEGIGSSFSIYLKSVEA